MAAFAYIREERRKGYDSPTLLFFLCSMTPSSDA